MLEERIPVTFTVLRLSFVMTVMAIIMNIGMSTFYNAPLQGFLWLWMGVGASAARTIREAARPYVAHAALVAARQRPLARLAVRAASVS